MTSADLDPRGSTGRSQRAARRAGRLFLFLAVCTGIWPGDISAAPAAEAPDTSPGSLYARAGAAYRSGEYRQAASLWEQAERAGYPEPVLFYNLGVAHYRLGNFDAAEAAFATAAAFEELAPLAYYNLGLVARRRDDARGAHGWFRQAALHPKASLRLRALSRKALATLPKQKRRKPTVTADRDARLSDFLRFSFDTGYGTDSNVFRAPKAGYPDLLQPGTPIIDPLVQSGSFVPLLADAEFRWAPYEHGYFSVRYDFDGRIYSRAEQKNANAFRNRLSIGGRVRIPEESGYRYFRSYFAITSYDENYYDRTDGQDIFIGTTDISDRFKRTKFGPNIYYHRERGRFGYGLNAEAFINKYENDFGEPLDYLDLTHEQYQLGAHLTFDLLKHTAMRLTYNRYRRDYTQRRAKDANGVRFAGNDILRYDYNEAGLKISQDLGRRLDVSLAYRYTIRKDGFEGYDDYNRHSGLAQIEFRTRRLRAEAGLVYHNYDFPNGFAFDLPSAGEKTLKRMYAFFEARYRILPRYQIMMAAELDRVDATDPRSAYDRNQLSVGMRWAL